MNKFWLYSMELYALCTLYRHELNMVIMVFCYGTAWMESCSTYGGSRPNQKWTKSQCVTCYLRIIVPSAPTQPEMQQSMDKFLSACNAFGLTISTKKTEVIYQQAPHKEYNKLAITSNGESLKTVDRLFSYLCSSLFRSVPVRIDDGVDGRIAVQCCFWQIEEKCLAKKWAKVTLQI